MDIFVIFFCDGFESRFYPEKDDKVEKTQINEQQMLLRLNSQHSAQSQKLFF